MERRKRKYLHSPGRCPESLAHICAPALALSLFLAPSGAAKPIDEIVPNDASGDVRIEFSRPGVALKGNMAFVFFGRVEKTRLFIGDESFYYDSPAKEAQRPATPVLPGAQERAPLPSVAPPPSPLSPPEVLKNITPTVPVVPAVPGASTATRQSPYCSGVDAKYLFSDSERKTCSKSPRFRAFRDALKVLKQNVTSVRMNGDERWSECANRISLELGREGLPLVWQAEEKKRSGAEISIYFCDAKRAAEPVPQVALQPPIASAPTPLPAPLTPAPPGANLTAVEPSSQEETPEQRSLEGDVHLKIGGTEISLNERGWFLHFASDQAETDLVVFDSHGERLQKTVAPRIYPIGYTFEKSHPIVTGVELAETQPTSGERQTKGPLPALLFRPGYRPPKVISAYIEGGLCATWSDIARSPVRFCGSSQVDWPSAFWGINLFARGTLTYSGDSAIRTTTAVQVDGLVPFFDWPSQHVALDAGLGGYFFSSSESDSSGASTADGSRKIYVPKSYAYPYPIIVLRSHYRRPFSWRFSAWAIPAYLLEMGLDPSYGSYLGASIPFSETLGVTLFAISDAASLPLEASIKNASKQKTASVRLNSFGLGLSLGL